MLKKNLIKIEDKLYQKAEVVICETIGHKVGPIMMWEKPYPQIYRKTELMRNWENQKDRFFHVYICEHLSEKENFKTGDIVVNCIQTNEGPIEVFDELEYYNKRKDRYLRVISTTDDIKKDRININFNFSRPSDAFINSLIESKCTIKEVLIEIDSNIGICEKCGAEQLLSYITCNYNGICHGKVIYKLKTNTNNECSIIKLQQQFTRAELINKLLNMKCEYDQALIDYSATKTKTIEFNLEQWINQNI